MISSKNIPTNFQSNNSDFTIDHYKELLRLAEKNWNIVHYEAIPWGSRFLLWRHDIDYSINRSLALARIEADAGVMSTYFVDPHSEFYNAAELDQVKKLKKIADLGHKIGLHFDGEFYADSNETDLNNLIFHESQYLERLLGVKIPAFSFHNPVASHLKCDAEEYGGLINCYSKRFKEEVSYCSDSNGYWRFRRLHDVLANASDKCLQVLTHPAWWVNNPMSPWDRINRCVKGRGSYVLKKYESQLQKHKRINFGKD